MRRTVLAIAGLVMLGSAASCGQSSLHSAGLDRPDPPPPGHQAATPAVPITPAAQLPGRSTTTATPFASTPQLLAAVQRAVAGKRTARIDYTGVTAGPGGARTTTTGVLSWAADGIALDHTTAVRGIRPNQFVDDHRILTDGVLYENLVPGLLDFAAPTGRPWLRIAADEPSGKARQRVRDDQALAGYLWPLGQLAQFGPAARITGAAADAQQGGAATRYDLTVDLRQLPPAAGPEAAAVAGSAARTHQDLVHYQLWLGPDDLPLRLASDVPDAAAARAGHTAEFTGWGAAPPVTAPPQATVCTTHDLRPA